MKYKNVLMGIIFYIVVSGIEKGLNLQTFSLLIPLTIIAILLISIKMKMKKRSE